MLIKEAGKVITAAELYIQKGWAVMPCLPNKKEPHFGLIRRSHLDATKEIEVVKFWLKMDPQMNLGISAIASGLVIIDIDYRNGGQLDDRFAETFTVKTGDGFHLYYKANPEATYRNGLGDGFDIKYKGYVIAAPSLHPNGAKYEVTNDTNPVALPQEIEDQICRFPW